MIKHKYIKAIVRLSVMLYIFAIVISCCTSGESLIKYEPRVIKTKNELITEYMKAIEVLRYNNMLNLENIEQDEDKK